jgi:hypothetical protein
MCFSAAGSDLMKIAVKDRISRLQDEMSVYGQALERRHRLLWFLIQLTLLRTLWPCESATRWRLGEYPANWRAGPPFLVASIESFVCQLEND